MARSPALRWITAEQPLPRPQSALREPDGLLCAGEDLSDARLLEAYRQGIFPWYSDGQPVLWWSPDPRMVLYLDDFKQSRSLTKTLRRVAQPGGWRITLDRCFETVMRACAEPRPDQDGTWITDEIVAAYSALARRGLAHSIEVWEPAPLEVGAPRTSAPDDAAWSLIGGFYGVSIGRMFYGESMFARRTDASKVALASWIHTLRTLGFRMIDCQQRTRHLGSLGAAEIERKVFLNEVAELTALPPPDWKAVKLEFPKV